MIRNYLKIAWRNLIKHKAYSAINIIGLAVGLAAFIFITLYVQHELSFDKFNTKADRIYRVNSEIKFGNNHLDLAVMNPLFGETAKQEFSQVEQYTRLRWYGELLIKKGNENIKEGNVAWADASLFEVFTLPMIAGNPKTALSEPGSIVITETVAKRYFNTTDVVGKVLTINNTKQKKITGVIKDVPQNCHFRFSSFLPNIDDPGAKEPTWAGDQNWNTYLLLQPGVSVNDLTIGLNKMYDKHLEPQLQSIINKSLSEFNAQGDYFKTSLIRLTDIHLHSNKIGELYGNGSLQNVYIFSAIALFILIIACINFMNLSTARSSNRAREVGIRKVLGSYRSSLISQFISESLLTGLISLIIAIGIVYFAMPAFNTLTGQPFSKNILFSPEMILAGVGLIIIVGLLAGSYPAFYLSSFIPVKVLKNNKGTGTGKSRLRNALVVFQFASSVILVAGTIIIFQQMDYIRKKDIGYNRDQLLIIYNTRHLGSSVETFRNKLLQINGVDKVAVSGFLPVNFNRSNNSFFPNASLATSDAISMQDWTIDENYIPALEMKLVQGRNFSREMKTDSTAIILNESAARFLGGSNVIGKQLYRLIDEETKALAVYHVIGVVKDFNFSTFRDQVKPLSFTYGKDAGSFAVKIHSAGIPALLTDLKSLWKSFTPDIPLHYTFMDDEYNRLIEGEEKTGRLFSVFTFLAIFIACLGLFGLAAYMAEQRTREIGIRKVLGASVSTITQLLSKDFLKLVFASIFIAIPIAWYLMNRWLQEFAYRISLNAWVFVITGFLIIVIAVLTVSFQAIKAAIANPVKSLRTE